MNEVRNELQKSYGTGYNDGYSKGYEDGCADRKESEWIPRYHQGVDKLICECSNCHTLHAITNYCPNCGAKMFAKDINVPNKKGVENE